MTEAGQLTKRYEDVSSAKADGIAYTPPVLAEFVADRIASAADLPSRRILRILDPAVGRGQLLLALLRRLSRPVEVYGYETDPLALAEARSRIGAAFPDARLRLKFGSFLDHVSDDFPDDSPRTAKSYDLVIANPPYVRTQVIGADRARRLAAQFGLTGRVDLYHAFLLGMTRVLSPGGTAGFIVSNRFMSTRGGAAVRAALLSDLRLVDVFDLGDTKLFEAAILPAVLVARGNAGGRSQPRFHTIYETGAAADHEAAGPLDALARDGVVAVPDGRTFSVRHGLLENDSDPAGVWRLASPEIENWLDAVAARTWGTFRDIGRIRVGVKTCADRVFLAEEWEEDLELHRPLTTHHIGRRFRPVPPERKILYPHDSADGRRRAVDLGPYPKSRAYLEANRETLESRRYVIEAGRRWYEIWVPQSPAEWSKPKLVFRDISEKPVFWMDLEGTVVNGDCYWLTGDENLLWLALAVANSTFIERFYDCRFNIRLYAGRRRFVTQYVERFPLPDPAGREAREIAERCRALYARAAQGPAPDLERELDERVWAAFGLLVEET